MIEKLSEFMDRFKGRSRSCGGNIPGLETLMGVDQKNGAGTNPHSTLCCF